MDTKLIETLLTAIDAIVRADGSWQQKRTLILEHANATDRTNLFEFVVWFEDEEVLEEDEIKDEDNGTD